MSNNDDEFNDVVKGLPSENTAQKSSVRFLLAFIGGGIILAMVIFQLGSSLIDSFSRDNFIPPQVLMNGFISLLIGSLQAWIFKSKIKSRIRNFIAFSLLGGVLGGFVGGLLMNTGLLEPFTIGAINGLLAGGISSLAQNRLMGNKKYGTRWFIYNAVSWGIIYAIAWWLAWRPNIVTLSLASGFLMIASGVSLVVFLRKTPQIEFS